MTKVILCEEYDHWRTFWDPRIWETQMQYCFGTDEAANALMPYYYPPVQTWVYMALAVWTGVLGYRIWERGRS